MAIGYNLDKFRAIHDRIVVKDLAVGDQVTKGGIIIPTDDAKERGIRARWAQVYSVGPEQKMLSAEDIGKWVLIDHGRWTRGISGTVDNEDIVIRMVDPKDVLAISDTKPQQYDL